MGTFIVILVVVAIIAVGLVLSQPQIRDRIPFGRRTAGPRPARRREPDARRRPPSPREERALISEGEAIRERVEDDLRQTPPAVRAQTLASRAAAGSGEVPLEDPAVAPGHGPSAGDPYADDGPLDRERAIRREERARRRSGG